MPWKLKLTPAAERKEIKILSITTAGSDFPPSFPVVPKLLISERDYPSMSGSSFVEDTNYQLYNFLRSELLQDSQFSKHCAKKHPYLSKSGELHFGN